MLHLRAVKVTKLQPICWLHSGTVSNTVPTCHLGCVGLNPGASFTKPPLERISFRKGRYFFPLGRPLKKPTLSLLFRGLP